MDIKSLSEILGHADVSITLNIYMCIHQIRQKENILKKYKNHVKTRINLIMVWD